MHLTCLLKSIVGLGCSTLVACGSASSSTSHAPAAAASAATTDGATTPEPAPAASAPASADSQAVNASASPVAPAAASKSAYAVGGTSLSDVNVKALKVALEKAGYGLVGPTEPTVCGAIETVQLNLTRKAKPVGTLSVLRQASAPKPDCTPTSIQETHDTWKKAADEPKSSSAMLYDEKGPVLVAVTILKDGAAARTLLETLVTKP
jgi:hypothetical protein